MTMNQETTIEGASHAGHQSLYPLLETAENCAYSAKSHFKSADWLKRARHLVSVIVTGSLFSVAIPYFAPFSDAVQTVAVIAAMLNVLIVIETLSPGKESRYMAAGEDFLKLYYHVRDLYLSRRSLEEKEAEISDIQKRYNDLPRLHIGRFAWRRARESLEHKNPTKDEIDLRWLRKEKELLFPK